MGRPGRKPHACTFGCLASRMYMDVTFAPRLAWCSSGALVPTLPHTLYIPRLSCWLSSASASQPRVLVSVSSALAEGCQATLVIPDFAELMENDAKPKWGIVGAGVISHDFCQALAYEAATIHAVAASDGGRAAEFAAKFGANKSYGSYEELARDPDVDVVYIGTVHTQHVTHATMMLRAGKHVLCEKPLGMNAKEVELLMTEAKQAGKLLLEGLWTRHFPVVKRVREILDSGELGRVRQVYADFGFVAPLDPAHRLWNKEVGGGCLLDVGCYVVAWGTFACGSSMPKSIAASAVMDMFGHGVDESVSIALAWEDCTASLASTLRANTPEETRFVCDNGWITIHGPAHCPTRATVTRVISRTEKSEKLITEPLPQYPDGHPGGSTTKCPYSEGFVYQVRAMQELLAREDPTALVPAASLEDSLTRARIMDEVLSKIGVQYNF